MCVIGVCDKRRATEDELERMYLTNGDGAGIAWREKSNPKLDLPDIVKWEKNLGLDDIKVFNAEVPLPYVLHFRIASTGSKAPELCHPFPVEKQVRQDFSGTTRGSVLFHNGTWTPWRDKGIDGAIRNGVRVPDGLWSDTRVMAWLAHLHGPGILNLIDEKIILFSPTKIEIFHIDGWFRVDDLLVSNRVWEHYRKVQTFPDRDDDDNYGYMRQGPGWTQSKMCRAAGCVKEQVATTFYCAEHQPDCRHYECRVPRIAGTEFCAQHQPMCKTIGCNNPRQAGETLCLTHLITPPVKTEALVKVVPTPPAVLTDPHLQEQVKWVKQLNPKAYRSNGQPSVM